MRPDPRLPMQPFNLHSSDVCPVERLAALDRRIGEAFARSGIERRPPGKSRPFISWPGKGPAK